MQERLSPEGDREDTEEPPSGSDLPPDGGSAVLLEDDPRGSGGGEPALVTVAREIAEFRRRERELRGFYEAVENAGHAICITDVDGTIEYVNPAFEETTGYDAEEAVGENPRILNSGEHDEAFYEELWETILGGERWQGEVVNERPDGERYVVDQTIAPITDADGEVERFVAINTDVTERRERERELQRTNERLEQFATVVSHDLRNPLGVALGRTKLAQEDCDSEHLEAVHRALERMDAIVDDVLALARQGAADLERERVDIEALSRDCWRTVDTGDAELVVKDPPTLRADTRRLRQLLENLFCNATEHAGDDVTVTVGRLPDGFYVSDDGPGIPPEEHEEVFEHGYSTTDDGTGFGLSIVQAIAEVHGWTVDVTESAAGGAGFEVHGADTEAVR
jgi:PAS domain S-box-containing protein